MICSKCKLHIIGFHLKPEDCLRHLVPAHERLQERAKEQTQAHSRLEGRIDRLKLQLKEAEKGRRAAERKLENAPLSPLAVKLLADERRHNAELRIQLANAKWEAKKLRLYLNRIQRVVGVKAA